MHIFYALNALITFIVNLLAFADRLIPSKLSIWSPFDCFVCFLIGAFSNATNVDVQIRNKSLRGNREHVLAYLIRFISCMCCAWAQAQPCVCVHYNQLIKTYAKCLSVPFILFVERIAPFLMNEPCFCLMSLLRRTSVIVWYSLRDPRFTTKYTRNPIESYVQSKTW